MSKFIISLIVGIILVAGFTIAQIVISIPQFPPNFNINLNLPPPQPGQYIYGCPYVGAVSVKTQVYETGIANQLTGAVFVKMGLKITTNNGKCEQSVDNGNSGVIYEYNGLLNPNAVSYTQTLVNGLLVTNINTPNNIQTSIISTGSGA